MPDYLDRKALKKEARDLLGTAQVSPKAMTALYLGLAAVLGVISALAGRGISLFSLFLSILVALLSLTLDAGFVLYCMTVRRRERAEYGVLFDGFGMVGKLILLSLTKTLFVFLWSLLFVIPGIIAEYRYRFALYNLLENPDLDVMEAIGRSKRQTYGCKAKLFLLDLSYLGWELLASVPNIVYGQENRSLMTDAIAQVLYRGGDLSEMFDAALSVSGTVWGLPPLAWQIIISAWALVVSLFYFAHFRCVDLAYYEIAKQSSGVGDGAPLWEDDGGSSYL